LYIFRNQPPTVTDSKKADSLLCVTETSASVLSNADIEMKKKLDARARRFAAPPPDVVGQISGDNSVRLRLGVKRPSDQGIGNTPTPAKQPMPTKQPLPSKQSLLISGRKSLAKATTWMHQKALREQQMLQLEQKNQTAVTRPFPNTQSDQQQRQSTQVNFQRQVSIKQANTQQQAEPVDLLQQTSEAQIKMSVGQILSQMNLQTQQQPPVGQAIRKQLGDTAVLKSSQVEAVKSNDVVKQMKADVLELGNQSRSISSNVR